MKEEILAVVHTIPYGHVVSYGMVAILVDKIFDKKTSGWMVGRILSSLPQSERYTCPRRRVVNKSGYISSLKLGPRGLLQKQCLEKEGISVIHDTVCMKTYGWKCL